MDAQRCHLAEWYRADLTDAVAGELVDALRVASDADPADHPVRVLVSLSVPSDEVVYVVFSARESDHVVDVCRGAGLPPQRVTSDIGLGLPAPV